MSKRSRKIAPVALALVVFFSFGVITLPARPLAPAKAGGGQGVSIDRGAAALGQAINRLGVVASVLHTGAHPDDEDSGLLAYLARGRQARTAYLSLTRGDGGQNLIGPELFEALGVIRTEEMMSARRLDGAQQFFSRAFDFGFSKARDEALAKWDREAVLGDMVRVIRTFRPLVIVSQWSGTPSDGHGHHQAAGYLTVEAYKAAADPSRFPEQIASGLRPWKALKLYARDPERRADGAKPAPGILLINTGSYDPLFGRSYYEIAMEGRSMHRSQDQGALQQKGPHYSRLKLLESSVQAEGQERDIFDGIGTGLMAIHASAVAAGMGNETASRLRAALQDAQQAADEAKKNFNPLAPSALSPIIARGLKRIVEAREMIDAASGPEADLYDVKFTLAEKEKDYMAALAGAEGIVIDCIADDDVVTPGQLLRVTLTAYTNPSAKLEAARFSHPEGWEVKAIDQTSADADGRTMTRANYNITVPKDAEPSGPYWLKNPRRGDMFVPGEGRTGIEPNAPFPLVAQVTLTVNGQKVLVNQPVEYRFADKALGEIRRELKVAPAVSVTLSPARLIFPTSANPVTLEVTASLTNNSKDGSRGELSVSGGDGWAVTPPAVAFDLKREGERASHTFKVQVPPSFSARDISVSAEARAGGRGFTSGYQVVSYPHIEPRFIPQSARARVLPVDVKVAPGLKVGFIEGAGDDFPNAVKRLGVDLSLIDPRELATGDLGRYDVIVTGIRVYEVRPDIVAQNARLLEYVRNGGTLIVQYNKNEYAAGDFAPYKLKMNRVPDRVTDERASVRILDPAHPLFNFPNKITDKDFEGWVQERGAYFMAEWDPQFKPLIASNDPGEEPKQGGELIAQYGKGYYIYSPIAWFRQLPEGVPGAYRLVANLISFPKARK
ncbi:MAG TPA: PIG-L family deacetylase [Blastocatellia bacterium]|nr:PIG-L family deacetylase [Blastocatellia bacterium]